MLGLLSSLKQEGIDGVRTLRIEEEFAVGVKVSSLKTQINLAHLLLELPEAIKQIEQNLEKQQAQVLKMKNAQEGGEI